ncbi:MULTISPECIES: TerD family protein [Acinetobacter]|uniref:TerD family protein n=1 Tax=Acinetobacter indicus TaxID=756892 RepID=A0A6C0YPU5_9GAMM|nr:MULTISPECIES: TerD family protein [Acinetobacter]MDM1292528.1 TerD family protein [Acinetobacter indicus]MDM1322560.1 TerD family protein [Acinetobacter indicus]MDM1334282.1 TerD family protein [Acinetobacter indicus]QFS16905.1 TerD family protein [Acinetobacter indicus]QIC70679.1 TerD family protein [Acinetobacter indicus]
MTISLQKGQGISLKKNDGTSLTKVFLGTGWDVAKSGSGFFGKLLGGGDSIDLDASVIMFDDNKQYVDNVYFGQLKSRDGSVVHSGDNLTGEGDGDDEVIKVDLTRVPANVSSLVFTISSFRGQTFKNVSNAFCRLVDATNNTEIAKYNLSQQGDYTALIIAKIYRHNGEWKMKAIGETCQGRTLDQMKPTIINFI